MQHAAPILGHPYPQSLVAEVAAAIWVREAVRDGAPQQWAEEAWADMGGSEPNDERALLEIRVGEALHTAPRFDSLDELVRAIEVTLD